MMGRCIFLDSVTLGPRLSLVKAAGDWADYPQTAPDQVVARLAGARIAITNKVPIRAEHIAALPALECIVVAATGYDIIDMAACRARGITVCNVRGYSVNSVPEHVFALILGLSRSLCGYRDDVIAGEWTRAQQFCLFTHPVFDLAGKTLGLIGGGAIGAAVGRLGQAFGMRVIYAARKGAAGDALRMPFAQVLAEADVLSLHCPLNAETEGLIGAAELAQMARRPLLINTARGGLVDEAAAVHALESGQISGLGFDVTRPEPPRADNPLLAVAHRSDVILTPHTAWASGEAMATLWAQVLENVAAFRAGAPIRVL